LLPNNLFPLLQLNWIYFDICKKICRERKYLHNYNSNCYCCC